MNNKIEKNKLTIGIHSQFSGPIPPPQILEKYNKIVPNAANRILKMAEKQSAHRQYLEKELIEASIKNERLGLWFGFFIGLIAILSGVFCVYLGSALSGSFIGTGGVIGLVVVFIYGSKSKSKKNNPKQ